MFKKKKCRRCGKKIEKKYNFCPYCGSKMYSNREEGERWGMLGKGDFIPSTNEIKLPLGFKTLFNSLMKNLSREFDEQLNRNYFEDSKNLTKTKKDGISINISTFGNGHPRIKVTKLGNKPKYKIEKEKIKLNTFTKEQIEQFAKLPKEKPLTNIRRLSNKITYKLNMPGVKSKEDISIIKLDNSIEIKAISKDKAYTKLIPISLPIKNYNFSKGELVLELGIKN